MPRLSLHSSGLLLALLGCTSEPAPWFEEQATERGLVWTHQRGRTQRFWFPEIMGGGVGLLDLDEDGALDVYLVQSGDLADPSPNDENRFFRNLGNGRFEDDTTRAGGAERGYGMGCAVADADGDGSADVYVTNLGANALLRNVDGVLVDGTEAAGVGDPGWSTSAAWLDLESDGDLDLFVVNYLRWSKELELDCKNIQGARDYCSPLNYDAPARDRLYRNEGGGHFTDITEAAGLGAAFGTGLGAVAGDLDSDGWVDLYVANDMMPNQLWRNRGDGTFADRALLAGCAVNRDGAAEAGMGTVAVDADDDGDLDLFVTHLRDETNTFYRNQGGLFSDTTGGLGLGGPSLAFTGFGLGFQDFDRDGLLDLYVANGSVTRARQAEQSSDPYAEPNMLFRGLRADGELAFEEVLPRGGTTSPLFGSSRGVAFGDLDEDGDVDLVLVDSNARVKLLDNRASSGSWIGLDVRERSGATAEGALVSIEQAERVRWRRVTTGGSYCASNDARILCGLGKNGSPVRATVRWVDGAQERFGPLATDRKHRLARGAGEIVERE